MVRIPIIAPSALRALLKSPQKARVVPIDASWYMPNNPRNAKDEFLNKERIPNSAFFDVDKISLPNASFPHTLPTYGQFNSAVKELGIKNTDRLVVYDKTGIFSSPRVAWTFALFGHKDVQLLDNYVAYVAEKSPLATEKVSSFAASAEPVSEETAEPSITELEFDKQYKEQVIEYDELLELVKTGQLTKEYFFFDARSNDRFTGKADEPRAGLSSGHVPGSLSLPFTKLLDGEGFKSKSEILDIFSKDFGLDLTNDKFLQGKQGIIVSCGSGVTAVIIKFAIQSVVGLDVPIRVYDGSWTEWASRAPAEYIVKDTQ